MKKKYPDLEPTLSIISEAVGGYIGRSDVSTIDRKNSLSYLFDDKFLLIHFIKQGMPYDLFDEIKQLIPFTESEWAEYLGLSTKSLQRYSNEKAFRFKPLHTEKILELLEVVHSGLEVFDSAEQFHLWLVTPSMALGSHTPQSLLSDSYGKEIVIAELNRIEHGIFA